MTHRKICSLDGVRSYGNGDEPVELWFNTDVGRMVIVTYNEGGLCATEIDLDDLLQYLQRGSQSPDGGFFDGRTIGGIRSIASGNREGN